MLATRLHRAGLTLVEVAISILVMAILAGMVLVNAQTNVTDQIGAACQIVAADMARARSLAVTNNDKYRFTFSIDNNWYYLQYTGSNSALNSLPSTPYYTGKDTATQQYTIVGTLPDAASKITLYAVGTNGSSPAPTTQVEFGAYGSTTATDETQIWLTAGAASGKVYQCVRVNPITGLATVDPLTGVAPSSALVSGS